MYRFLSKFIVAYLVLLGDSAFAAEYCYDGKNENTIESYSSQLTLFTWHEQVGSSTSAPYASLDLAYTTQSASVFSLLFIDHADIIPNRLKHSRFSPRAPPLQRNTI